MALKNPVPASRAASDSGVSRYSPIRHALGKGGMGTVELATRREGRFLRVYAIKRLSDELRASRSGRDMFMDEARVAGLLRHPNVVSVLDVGEDERGPYLVMDYVKGLDLARIIRGLRQRGRRMPIDVALRILADLAAGLHAAHELRGPRGEPLGLVHRDVSPHNVLIDFEGIVRLTDFGVAKAVGQASHTSTGVLKGKIGYMAPEQLRFEPVDRRGDLFALGVVGFEVLAGERLFRGETPSEIARAVLRTEIPDLAEQRDDVPPALHELLLRMLASDPQKRPATAADIRRRLESILREWALEHGDPRDIGEFLQQSFEEHRAQVETLYAKVLAEGERSIAEDAPRAGVPDESVEVEVGTMITTPDPTGVRAGILAAHGQSTGRRRLAIAATFAGLLLVGAAITALASSSAGDTSPSAQAPSAPAPGTATAPEATPPIAAAPRTEPTRADPPAAAADAVPPASAESEPPRESA
jgi:serine/threonine protein kinase